jgi:hypothetical protein
VLKIIRALVRVGGEKEEVAVDQRLRRHRPDHVFGDPDDVDPGVGP